jgi:hypothetical protein
MSLDLSPAPIAARVKENAVDLPTHPRREMTIAILRLIDILRREC